jgi:SAM-dependent methyltransferase
VGELILKGLDRWYKNPLGRAFAKMQRAEIDALLPQFRGRRLLQLGINPGVNLQSMLSIPYCISLLPTIDLKQSDISVVGTYQALPFLSDSLDVVLINQVLEFENELELIFEEIARVLVGGGQVVIMGFNACSLWGLVRLFKCKSAQIPWNGHFHSILKLKHALLKAGFGITLSKTFFIRPPFQNSKWLNYFEFLERGDAKIGSLLGAGYLLVGRKQVLASTPLHSRWDFSQLVIDRAVKPVART